MEYRSIIKEELSKTGLKPASVKLYSIKLNKLYNILKGKDNNNNHLLNKSNVMEFINALSSVDDKLAYLNSIIKIINNESLKNYYTNERNNLNKQKFDKYKNNVQSDDFINYDRLLDVAYKPDFTQDIKTVLNQMLVYMSVRYPIRLSLWNIKIAKSKKDIKPNENYLYITTKTMKFIMQNFKNIDSMGPQEIDIEKEDQIIIRNYLKYLSQYLSKVEYLLYNYYNKILEISSTDMYARILKRLLNKRLNREITMNNIRHAYESKLMQSDEYKNMTNAEKEKAHLRLLHTGHIAEMVYNKVKSKN